MAGVISTKHLVVEARGIVREFGLKLYLRCVFKVLTGQKFTFLDMVMGVA
jgi:hypothetical protein